MLKKLNKAVGAGLRQFVIRTIILVFLILTIKFAINHYQAGVPWIEATRLGSAGNPTILKPYDDITVVKTGIFIAVAFILFNLKSLKKLKAYQFRPFESVLFGLAAIAFYFLHYLFKYLIIGIPEIVRALWPIFLLIKLGLIGLFLVGCCLAVYGWRFFLDLYKLYKRQIMPFLCLGVIYYFLLALAWKLWYLSSSIVTVSVAKLLSMHAAEVRYELFKDAAERSAPVLYAAGTHVMNVRIADECSGVDGFLLFLSIFAIIMIIEWKRLDRKRMLITLGPALAGLFFYNILRIYLLMAVGIYIDPNFAVDLFHDNIGWILFLLYFIVYWNIASIYVYKK